MFQLGLVDIILADREREIESALRRRRLMRPEDGATEPQRQDPSARNDGRALTVPVRPAGTAGRRSVGSLGRLSGRSARPASGA